MNCEDKGELEKKMTLHFLKTGLQTLGSTVRVSGRISEEGP